MTSFKTPLKALALVSALALGGLGAGAATQAAVAPQSAQASCENNGCRSNGRCNIINEGTRCNRREAGGCEAFSCDALQEAL